MEPTCPKAVLPGEVHPVRNSNHCNSNPSGTLDPPESLYNINLATKQRGNISNGVNIIFYCALGSAHFRPVRRIVVFDYKI